MPRFAANLTLLFTEYPLVERIKAAADAGFEAVEILWPYDDPASLADLRAALDAAALPLVLLNTPRGDWHGDHWGSAAHDGAEAEFDAGLHTALAHAAILKPRHIHIMAGCTSGMLARAIYIRNLRRACDRAPDQSFTIEPISPQTLPGYFLSDFDMAIEILNAVDRPNLALQFDAYHAHLICGDMPALWQRMAPHITHIQIAGAPGRHEPTGGDIDYPAFFDHLDATGYPGWVSAEYNPKGNTKDGLGWLTGS